MTRKLFYTLALIVLFTLSFTYLLYNTSISERIAPDEIVMSQYDVMLDKIMSVEQKLEDKQIKPIIELGEACHIDFNTQQLLISKIVEETIKNEDALILEVSTDFFNIYFVRYILVRILIAIVIIGLIRYFINLYFRIQQERLDLIRKEEALSTLFYMLESKDGEVNEITGKVMKGSKKIQEFENSNFPNKQII